MENVGKFCYVGDMLNGGGGMNSASVARARCVWRKYKELSGILIRKEVLHNMKGKLYVMCEECYGLWSETWAMTAEQGGRLERTDIRMVKWMCGVSLRDRVLSTELRERMGIESVSDTVKQNRLRWLGHVLQKDDDDWVKKITLFEVEGNRGWGRPRMAWSQVVERDMREYELKRQDAKDRERWRRLLCKAADQPLHKQGKWP